MTDVTNSAPEPEAPAVDTPVAEAPAAETPAVQPESPVVDGEATPAA